MVNPEFISEQAVTLSETKEILDKIVISDSEPANYLSNKTKDFLATCRILLSVKREQLKKKLLDLGLIRLKPEHIVKIMDFLPQTIEELHIVLQGYPLSLPKKDQEEIVSSVKAFS